MPTYAHWPLLTALLTLQLSGPFICLERVLTQHVKVLAGVNFLCAHFNTKELNIQAFLLCFGFCL